MIGVGLLVGLAAFALFAPRSARAEGETSAFVPGRDGVFDIEYLRVQVVTALNTRVNGTVNKKFPDGILSIISIVPPTSIPRGRIYGRIEILDRAGEVVLTPWSGYVHSGGAPSSFPGIRVYQGQEARFVAAHGSEGAATRLTAVLGVTPVPVAGWPSGVFFYEPSGSGRGEQRAIALAAPAAGADYAIQTVPTACAWVQTGFSADLTTDATVASRVPEIHLDNGTSGEDLAISVAVAAATASVTRDYKSGVGVIGPGLVGDRVAIASMPTQIPAGFRVRIFTDNIQAGDQWPAGRLGVEEWAVI